MCRSFLLAVGLSGVLAGPVLAQGREDTKLKAGDYAPDFDAQEWLNAEKGHEPSLIELRGMVVIVFFWVSFHEGGENIMPLLNLVENNPGLGKANGVMVVGLTSAERKQVQKDIGAHKLLFPIGVGSKAHEEYGFQQFPSFVIIDPEGKIRFIGLPGGADQLRQELVNTFNESPPFRTHPEEAKVVLKKMGEAREALLRQQYRAAFRAAREAAGRALLGDSLKREAFGIIEILDAIGYDQLALVAPLLEQKKYREAAAILRRLYREFRGMDVANDAKARLKRLEEENEEFKQATGSLGADATAGRLLRDAIEAIQKRRFGEGYKALEKILTEHKDSAAAEHASGMVQRIKANPTVWAIVRDELAGPECQQALALAKTHIEGRRYEEARRLLRSILDKHPETSYADEAKRLLINLPR